MRNGDAANVPDWDTAFKQVLGDPLPVYESGFDILKYGQCGAFMANEFRRKHGLDNMALEQPLAEKEAAGTALGIGKPAGYRAGREPDASWYRPSNHRPPSQAEIEQDKELRRRNEARGKHNERMKAICEFFTPGW